MPSSLTIITFQNKIEGTWPLAAMKEVWPESGEEGDNPPSDDIWPRLPDHHCQRLSYTRGVSGSALLFHWAADASDEVLVRWWLTRACAAGLHPGPADIGSAAEITDFGVADDEDLGERKGIGCRIHVLH